MHRVLCLLCAIIFYVICGCSKNKEVAIVDFDKVFSSHKLTYVISLLQKKEEYLSGFCSDIQSNNLNNKTLQDIENEIMKVISSVYLEQIYSKEKEQKMGVERYERKTKKIIDDKVKNKKYEFEREIINNINEIEKEKKDKFKKIKDEIEKKYFPMEFNIKLKLKAIGLSKNEKSKLQNELDNIRIRKNNELQEEMKQLQEEIEKIKISKDSDIKLILENYKNELTDEMEEKIKDIERINQEKINKIKNTKKEVLMQEKDNIKNYTKSNNIKEEDLCKKQLKFIDNQIKFLQNKIMQDVKFIAEKIARERNIKLSYEKNVPKDAKIIDITHEVMSKLNY